MIVKLLAKTNISDLCLLFLRVPIYAMEKWLSHSYNFEVFLIRIFEKKEFGEKLESRSRDWKIKKTVKHEVEKFKESALAGLFFLFF